MKEHAACHRWIGLTALCVTLCLSAVPAFAQEEMPSQVNVQFSGLMNTDSAGNGITDHATRSAGLLTSYTYFFKKWAGIEGGYGYSRNTQNYLADGAGIGGVQTNIHELTGAFLFRLPTHTRKARPYALAGTGALQFRPTGDVGNAAGAVSQTKGVFVYGAGADFGLATHVGVRAEYRAFLYKAPDFAVSGLTTDSLTHLAEPSVGIFFKF
jgi:opacity protein-like surface antigen